MLCVGVEAGLAVAGNGKAPEFARAELMAVDPLIRLLFA